MLLFLSPDQICTVIAENGMRFGSSANKPSEGIDERVRRHRMR